MAAQLEKMIERIKLYTKSEKFKKKHRLKPPVSKEAPLFRDKSIRMSTTVFYVLCHVTADAVLLPPELDKEDYGERFGEDVLLRARAKVSPGAFSELLTALSLDFPIEKRWKKYQVLSLDGTEAALPHILTPEKKYYPMAMYDLFNGFFLCASFLPTTMDRYKETVCMLEKLNPKGKQLLLLDKGFHSLLLLKSLEEAGKKYVIRASKSFLKEVNDFRRSEHTDRLLSIHYDKRRAHDAKLKYDIPLPYDFKIRCVKLPGRKKEPEILITNLSRREAAIEDLGALFSLRWPQKERRHMKEVLNPAIYDGVTEQLVKQDFYASLLRYNLILSATMRK